MQLTTIGTGTAAPHAQRGASAHLVATGGVRLLLDCGAGCTHRMEALGISWRDLTHVAITHFHPDHVADLVMLLMAWKWGQLPPRAAPVTIIGPTGFGAHVEGLAALYGDWILAPGFPCTYREILPDEVLTLTTGVTLAARHVPHTVESVAYSVDDGHARLVYTGDTGPSEALGDWAHGASLLLAECSLPESLAIGTHLTPRLVGALAGRARPELLVLTHFYAPVEAVDIVTEVAEQFAGRVVLATDGWSVEL
jgi:ribonuclease BN (tRNA processing enzyme)